MPTGTAGRPDWETRDPQACEHLGEALSKIGYVIWRPKTGEWAVMDPARNGEYRTVRSLVQNVPVDDWERRLWCDCARFENAEKPCVHKAAVYHEVRKPSPWRMYHDGY